MDESILNLPLAEFLQRVASLGNKESYMTEWCRRKEQVAEQEKQARVAAEQVAEQEKQARGQEKQAREAAEQVAEQEKQAREAAEQVAEQERQARLVAEGELQWLQEISNGSKTMKFDFIMKNVKKEDDYEFSCPSHMIKAIWQKMKSDPNIVVAGLGNENKQVHPVFMSILNNIFSCMQIPLKPMLRTSVVGSRSIPDILVVRETVLKPGYPDVLAVIELKLPGNNLKDATTEAMEYFLEVIKEISNYRGCIAIASDINQIMILYSSDGRYLHKMNRTDPLELLPDDGWINLTQPTGGFAYLCDQLYRLAVPEKKIIVNGVEYSVVGTVQEDDGIGLYRITVQDRIVIAKVGIGKRGMGFVPIEHEKYQKVVAIPEMNDYVVPLLKKVPIRFGFAMEEGEPITQVVRFLKLGSTEADEFLEVHLLHLLEGLKILHSQELFHLDIRPSNIVILNELARLIDWASLNGPNDDVLPYYQGHTDPFWPKNSSRYPDNFPYSLWDVISLCYSFIFLSCNQNERASFYRRNEFIGKLISEGNNSRLATKLAKAVDALEAGDVSDAIGFVVRTVRPSPNTS